MAAHTVIIGVIVIILILIGGTGVGSLLPLWREKNEWRRALTDGKLTVGEFRDLVNLLKNRKEPLKEDGIDDVLRRYEKYLKSLVDPAQMDVAQQIAHLVVAAALGKMTVSSAYQEIPAEYRTQ